MIELKLLVEEIDYESLSDTLVPLLVGSMKGSGILGDVLAGNSDLAVSMARSLLRRMPEEKKNELLLQLLEKNNAKVLEALEREAAKAGVKLKLAGLSAQIR